MDPGDLDAVDVLLVDDDVDWLAVTGQSLEEADGRLTVRTAASGGEALDVLERAPVDCVVCDYQMPGMDGVELLERVRAGDRDLPFILVTGAGSEAVASSAISASVTDYFVKDPAVEQATQLAGRIRSAVAAHRTSRALETARRRFAGLFENVPSPLVVVDDEERVLRTNDAFRRTFGVDPADLRGTPLDAHLDAAADLADGGRPVSTVELSTAEGDRQFVVRRFPLGTEHDDAGYAFTDVTDQRRRQRDLERALALDAEVRDLLLSAPSRDHLERSFCETVAGVDDVVLAVVAERDPGGALAVRASAGDPGFDPVAGAASTTPEGAAITEPLGAALRDREPRVVADLSPEDDGWAGLAADAGVGSAMAVPIDRWGVPDGVFGVYAGSPDALDDERREQLSNLVASLGDAVGLVERMGALTADRVIAVRLSTAPGGPLTGAAAAVEADLELRPVQRTDGTAATYVDVPADGEVRSWLADDDRVESVDEIGEGRRLRVRTAGRSLPEVVYRAGGSFHSLTATGTGYEAVVDVPPSTDVQAVVDGVDAAFDGVFVHSIRSRERRDRPTDHEGLLSELTDKQREVLRTAYVEGYFDRPRKRSSEEIGESLSIAGATFLQHLRAAQRKLLGQIFD